MKIDYQLSKEAFIDGLDSHICRSGSGMARFLTMVGYAVLLVIAVAFVGTLAGSEELAGGDLASILREAAPMLLLLALVAAGIRYGAHSQSKAKRSFATMVRKKRVPNSYIGPHTIEVEGSEITLTYGAAGRRYSCAEVDAEADDRHGGVLLFMDAGLLDVLPADAFAQPGSREEFLECFRQAKAAANAETWGGRLEGYDEERASAELALDFYWDRAGYPDAVNHANHIWFKSKLYWTPGRKVMAALAVVCLCACAALAVLGSADEPGLLLPALGALAAAALLGYHPLMTGGNRTRGMIRNQIISGSLPGDTLGPQLFCLTGEGVTLYRKASRHDLSWSDLRGAVAGEDGMVVLVTVKGRLMILPAAAFPDDETRRELLKRLNRTPAKENVTK